MTDQSPTAHGSPAADVSPPRPALRGWSHALGAVGAVPTLAALVVGSSGDPPRAASMLVYGLSMLALLTASASYHLRTWRPSVRAALRALDHASIYLLIAGTYTPIAFNVLTGGERLAVLVAVWALASVGIGGSLAFHLPRWARTALYVLLGWAALVPAPSIVRALPFTAVAGLVTGGLLYTVGALVYAARWPDPLPRIFGFHEVFHLFVIAAAAVFAGTIWIWVVPFPRV